MMMSKKRRSSPLVNDEVEEEDNKKKRLNPQKKRPLAVPPILWNPSKKPRLQQPQPCTSIVPYQPADLLQQMRQEIQRRGIQQFQKECQQLNIQLHKNLCTFDNSTVSIEEDSNIIMDDAATVDGGLNNGTDAGSSDMYDSGFH
eukprot:Protomagalhaensia_wolfi_Nauph_80__6194@NODE_91_length_3802_cov_379_199309_g68_i0_p4_GENE_NODE_91_length_3802_cov_379_199309_g68_i0NODE_91_length_3802_cov_379_199309_g68_i0_p4_ORF_typecomplete_len144_score35_27DUF4715/PF15835_5/0_069YlqD/PF11068_8/3_1e03YlqD/PF11068_8/0_056Activator_LAG3/PF11498_8/0_37_NODE_91_length_3802_cov_379_199309_g68_i011251556